MSLCFWLPAPGFWLLSLDMKISLEWLREYVDVPESAARLKEDLTMAGLLVESVSDEGGGAVLEIEVTSNRPDCLSHIGIAREVAALYGRTMKHPPACSELKIPEERVPYSVEIRDADLCPRYVGLVMDNVRIAPSPYWMQRRLLSVGVRPINNVVDITNYVLMELGHPLHAFDFDRLRQGRIVVARAHQGQKFVTLDGVERELDSEMLLINDGEGPSAIAGVMGGGNSEIVESTRRVLLESAYFRPASVRRTSKKLELSTEASYRFERGADWENTVAAISRTCRLIQELAGGQIAGSVQDVYPAPIPAVKIPLNHWHAEALIGVSLTDEFVESTLAKLGFVTRSVGPGSWEVVCPTWRADMELEADMIEELARFYGYQNIPTTIPAIKSVGVPSPVFPYDDRARRILLGLGYSEAVNLSFAGDSDDQEFAPFDGLQRVAVQNPLTEDTRYLRTSLVPALVRSAKRNFNHGNRQPRLFELGKRYFSGSNGAPTERTTLGILGSGSSTELNWLQPSGDYRFFQLKGVITTLLEGMRSAPHEMVPAPEIPWLNPADAATLIVDGVRVGVLGSLHPAIEEQYKLKQPVYVAEIDFAGLSRHVLLPVHYESLPKYPPAERDLCVVVSREVTYGAIRAGILSLGIAELTDIGLIDVYEGEGIPPGRVSITLHLTFLDRQKTLTVDRVQSFSDNVLAFLQKTFGAELR